MADALAATMKATLVERRRRALISQRQLLAAQRLQLDILEEQIIATLERINSIKRQQHENGDPQ